MIGALVRTSHPEPAVAVTAVACGLAVATGRPAAGVVAVGLAALSGQLSVGWLNDYLDADRDAQAGRTDKPVATGLIAARQVGFAALVAGLACVPLSLLSGLIAAVLHLVAVAGTWGYNLGLKSTAFSVVPYAVAFGILPAFVVLGLPGAPAPAWWAVLAGALLGSGAHFANALPDLADDLAAGVRGLPHRLGPELSRIVCAVLLLAASLLLALGSSTLFGWLAVVIAAAALSTGFLLGGRAPFRSVLIVAVLDVLLLLNSGSALVG